MDQALYVPADASMVIQTAPLSADLQSALQPGGMGENELPWWHSIDEMIGNLPVDEPQKQRLKVYANAIAYPERAPDLTTDVAGIDGDVLRIVTTGARKIARQQARDAGMNKSTRAIDLFRETLSKAGGEGSRGGHIMGHTKSGKPVYSASTKHEGFSRQDHKEAAQMHRSESRDHEARAQKAEDAGNKAKAATHRERAGDSKDRAAFHSAKAGK